MKTCTKVTVAATFLFAFFVACTDDSSSTSADSGSSSTVEESSASQEPTSSAAKAATSSESVDISSETVATSSTTADNDFFTENWREDCLAKINEYRATENLPPLTLAEEEKQKCVDEQSAADLESNKAHGHFGDCGEWAQNSGPNFNPSWYNTAAAVSDHYLQKMWEEEKALVTSGERDPEKKEDYPYIGHYLNMKGNYTKVACGIALSDDGSTGWFNVNFH